MQPILGWASALLLTTAFIAMLRPIASHTGLVDRPSTRKHHTGNVPLVGGIAIALALLATLGLSDGVSNGPGLLCAGLSVVAIGIWDDVHKISSGLRLIVQSLSVLVLALMCDALIEDLGNLGLGGELLELGWFALPFTIFAGVGVINAINMSDGMDGLCGTLSLAALTGLGLMAALAGRQQEFLIAAVLGGAILGFLAFNFRVPGRPQAKAFLGDGGSYLVGILLVYLTIRLSQGDSPAMSPVTALWFIMVPLLDTVGMILRRLNKGRSPFSADREHLHHVFLLARFTVTETVLVIGLVALIGVAIGVGGFYLGVPESLLLAGFLAIGIGYYWMVMRAWKVMRFLSRSINRRLGREDRRKIADRRRADNPAVLATVGRERRSGFDRRRGEKDRRSTLSQPMGTAALQHRDLPAGGQARKRTEQAG